MKLQWAVTRQVALNLFQALAIIFFQACSFFSPVVEVNPDKFTDQIASKLVVGCFISPQDSVVRVSLTESKLLYDTLNQSSMVSDARIVLYSKSDSLVISDTLSGYYISPIKSFVIQGGEIYKLIIKTPDGRTVNSTCTVPDQSIQIKKIIIDSGFVRTVTVGNTPIDSTMERYASIQWEDPVGVNYYRVFGELSQSETIQLVNNSLKIDFKKLLFFNEENSRTMILSDKNQENGVMQSADGIYWTGTYRGSVIRQEIEMNLLNIDKIYYDYYQSINQASLADDNPFAEPINITGNINGGFGCFAAYNMSTIKLKIK
ncbi:DUF4249 domain-containing protein [Dyadobacter psychrotolerans]|uniref:DUF4249 domain-containing protein n=1 Tax=Dyadobacter psychrotolerans TaxID=2541721 RepID=A0A4R5DJH6_9BACT|nr:DUF4249 domain-containing protein [Dyadobacter psychrotolerans]TDE12140.1 DUF4249 domain-containing protein [Dyadobacter psychrotolerans]